MQSRRNVLELRDFCTRFCRQKKISRRPCTIFKYLKERFWQLGSQSNSRSRRSSSDKPGNLPSWYWNKTFSDKHNVDAHLFSERDLERSRIVSHHAQVGENPPQRHYGCIHPILPPQGSHSTVVLATVCEETSRAVKVLAADAQLDLRRLLNVAHPLTIHVCSADVKLVVQNEPDRDLVGLSGLTSVMSQPRCLLSGQAPQSVQSVGFHSPRMLHLVT